MRKLLGFLTALICTGACLGTAFDGPNAGGTLVLALSEGTAYSPDIDYCGSVTAQTCDAIVSRGGDDGSTVVINCLAAFNGGGRLAGVAFGVNYNPNSIVISDAGGCGDFELPDGAWPSPLSGTAVTWGSAQTAPLVPVYWFAAYNYYYYTGAPETLDLTPHPTQGGNFADDSVPSELDPIAGFGKFGFNDPGDAPCPVAGEPTGACCLADGTCIEATANDCAAAGGVYQGDNVPCTPDLCPDTITGACCFADGTCQELNDAGCATAGGVIRATTFQCSPDLPGHDHGCMLLRRRYLQGCACDCATAGGVYQGDNVPCSPDLCPDTITGACCFADGTCRS
ncbi:MAG: hypothetical protein R3E12_11660 [Candidatus Eisenbacteria bacterium]